MTIQRGIISCELPNTSYYRFHPPPNFDSSSAVMDERTREARLKLIGATFDRYTAYTLVLEDRETQTRYGQYALTIDLAFQDDFF